MNLVFYGDKMGNIYYFEENKLQVNELCKINGAIEEIFYHSENNSIIVITSTKYLIQFRISATEDIILNKK